MARCLTPKLVWGETNSETLNQRRPNAKTKPKGSFFGSIN